MMGFDGMIDEMASKELGGSEGVVYLAKIQFEMLRSLRNLLGQN